MPRTTAMAVPASTMPELCSSAFSSGPGGTTAIVVFLVCSASTVAPTKTIDAKPSTHSGPPSFSIGTAGTIAMKPTIAPISVSFAFASSSSSSLCTTVGTSAAFDTA